MPQPPPPPRRRAAAWLFFMGSAVPLLWIWGAGVGVVGTTIISTDALKVEIGSGDDTPVVTVLPVLPVPAVLNNYSDMVGLEGVVAAYHTKNGMVEGVNMTQMYEDSARLLSVLNRDLGEGAVEEVEAAQRPLCPPEPTVLKKKNGCVKCGKYRKYVEHCNTTGTLFMDVRLPSFLHVMNSIAKWVDLRSGHHILDWGSGCGTKLNYWQTHYNVTGLGIDYTKPAVDYSRQRGRPGVVFCWADGSQALKHIKNATYDRVLSHSALYHVMPVSSQCKVVYQAVRITRPGGVVWFGHFRSGPAIKFWKKHPAKVCPMPTEWNVTSHVVKDTRVFGGKESWYSSIGAVSIILKRGDG